MLSTALPHLSCDVMRRKKTQGKKKKKNLKDSKEKGMKKDQELPFLGLLFWSLRGKKNNTLSEKGKKSFLFTSVLTSLAAVATSVRDAILSGINMAFFFPDQTKIKAK